MNSPENCAERAGRWEEEIRQRVVQVEPDWWLRLECGQVLDTGAVDERTG